MNNQDKIWDYFQNESLESFSDAKPRIDFLIKQIAKQKLSEQPCVLNIGVGDGYFEETVNKKGWDVYALDPSKKVIERMKKMDIKAYTAYISKMPFKDEQFDFIVATEVLEHLSKAQRADGLNEVVRTLKKEGVFIGTVPFNENLLTNTIFCPTCEETFHRWGHQQSFDLMSLSKELSRYLCILELKKTAFVSFRHQSVIGKLKKLMKLVLAKCGETIATPNIYFCTKKASHISEQK